MLIFTKMTKNMKKLTTIALIVLAGLFVCGTGIEQSYKERECTRENVYQAIREYGIDNPHVVFAQMSIESADFGSRLKETNNNIAGMRLPIKRETTAVGQKLGYAFYESWVSSVADYLLYQKMLTHEKKLNDKQYIVKLCKKYAEDPGYRIKIVKKMKKTDMVCFYHEQDSLYDSRHIEVASR